MLAYAKALVAVATAVAAVVQSAITDGHISAQEWGLIVTAVITAIGVYLFPNKPQEG